MLPSLTDIRKSCTAVCSCVVDDDPYFRMQAMIWLYTAMEYSGFEPHELIVHLVRRPGDKQDHLESVLSKMGIRTVPVTAYGTGDRAYCNKLCQLETPDLYTADGVVLCDTDIAFADDVREAFQSEHVKAKVVDRPNPPFEILRELFVRSGLPGSPDLAVCSFSHQKTYATNCNGGLYVIPGRILEHLAPAWKRWTAFSLEQSALLGRYLHHSDQIGFCFAMHELGEAIAPLPLEMNFPTHLPAACYAGYDGPQPRVLHYHRRTNPTGFLEPVGLDAVDASIARVNDVIRDSRRRGFDNSIFWDSRYALHPELGSGFGSRGENLTYRRQIMYPIVDLFAEKSILDVGCGDLEVMCEAPAQRYTGIDPSPEAIALARKKRPDWNFITGDITAVKEQTFDLVYCSCVLIHLPEKQDYDALTHNLIDRCRDYLIVEAYDAPPTRTSEITFYYEPITETLLRDPRIGSATVIGRYRDVSIVLARRREALAPNPWDLPLHLLAAGSARWPDPHLLPLVRLSREKLGFFTRTVSRMLEYPWIASQLGDVAGKRIVDVGAGVGPLPFYLAERGALVATVDNHPRVQTLETRAQWNEWGFLNYGQHGERLLSFHEDASRFDFQDSDIVYSVSVLEHVQAEIRRTIFKQTLTWLRHNGRLLLTLDLIPGTEQLWNLNEGKLVDAPEVHGDIQSIVAELTDIGFRVVQLAIERNIPESRTDIALLEAVSSHEATA